MPKRLSPTNAITTTEANRQRNDNVSTMYIGQTFTKKIYSGLKSFKDDNGLSSEQDVVRLAVSFFLKKHGY